MRLFVSINLKGDVLKEVRQLQQQLCARDDARMRAARHVHITLEFLGAVEPENAKRTARALCSVKFSPFEVNLTHAGFFGARKRPRVIWLGLEPRNPLVELHAEVLEALKQIPHVDFGTGTFRPHVTLARVKQIYSRETLIPAIEAITLPPLKVRVEGFSLMQSTLQSDGATYTELGYYPAAPT